jgi:CheY-like chemotaxis protein
VILDPASAERALEVETHTLRRVELSVDVRERDLLLAGPHCLHRSRRDLVHARDGHEALGHRAEANKGLESARTRRYAPAVATILLAGVDLFFRGKLEALLPEHHLITTDGVGQPDLVIADIARIEPEEVADAFPEVPILGFTNHTDTAGLRAAKTAGFDQVVAKSALDERGRDLVEELLTSLE